MMLHTENPKDATRKPRELLNESGKDSGGKNNNNNNNSWESLTI